MKFKILRTRKKGGVGLSVLFLLGCSESGAMQNSGRRPVPRDSKDDSHENKVKIIFVLAEGLPKIGISVKTDTSIISGDLEPGKLHTCWCSKEQTIRCWAFSGDEMVIGNEDINIGSAPGIMVQVYIQCLYSDGRLDRDSIGFQILPPRRGVRH